MEITRQVLKDLRPQIEDALSELSEKHGIKMSVGNGSYAGLSGHFKLLLTTTGENGETAEQRDFNRFADDYGMDKTWLGMIIKVNGESYTIKGILPKRRKNPILVMRNRDGSERVMTTLGVRQAMLRDPLIGKVPPHWEDMLGGDYLANGTHFRDGVESYIVKESRATTYWK